MTVTHSVMPELAGLATYAEAARVGFPVEENVRRLERLHWTERRIMYALIAHLPATPEWELKCAMALHQYYAAQHADALRRRISEMRNPAPPLDRDPDRALGAFLDELLRAADSLELVAGMYTVALPALRDAYREHMTRANPLVDQPTRRICALAIHDLDEAIEWGVRAFTALVHASPDDTGQWQRHLRAYLAAAGGISGSDDSDGAALPPPRANGKFVPDFFPRRDARFHGLFNFVYPPHDIYNAEGIPADERNLALLCKRTLEMDVPEMMASFMTELEDQPWDFHRDYSRQLWDEARHAMMGTVAFEARGVDWKEIPLNVGFSLRLNLHAAPQERQIMLYSIEQSLMPGETGKRFEYETAVAAGDELSAHFHDYDWADEVLHAQIGRRALRRDGISRADAIRLGGEIHERTWARLDDYKGRDEQADWWPAFVRKVLGKESALRTATEHEVS